MMLRRSMRGGGVRQTMVGTGKLGVTGHRRTWEECLLEFLRLQGVPDHWMTLVEESLAVLAVFRPLMSAEIMAHGWTADHGLATGILRWVFCHVARFAEGGLYFVSRIPLSRCVIECMTTVACWVRWDECWLLSLRLRGNPL